MSAGNEMTEHNHQVALFKWADMTAKGRFPGLDLMFAIPNGGLRNRIVAIKLKAEGVKAGVPDIFLPVPRGQYHGLFIEMKKEGKTYPSKQQKVWIAALNEQGYKAVVCRGWFAASVAITDYYKE